MFLLVVEYVRDRNRQKVSAFYSLQKKHPYCPYLEKREDCSPYGDFSPHTFCLSKGFVLCVAHDFHSTGRTVGETIRP